MWSKGYSSICAWVALIFFWKIREKVKKIMEQICRIGIDHGYGNIKTAHHIFESGVIERDRASEMMLQVSCAIKFRRTLFQGIARGHYFGAPLMKHRK